MASRKSKKKNQIKRNTPKSKVSAVGSAARKNKKITKKSARPVSKKSSSPKSVSSLKKRKRSSRGILSSSSRRSRFSGSASIKVVGVGGGGGNALSRMAGFLPRGVELIAVNTDIQDLESCQARKRLYIGKQTTRGLGAGMNPELGRQSAEENREEIAQALSGADIVFLTAGFGGGTGSGALPVIAEVAKELGVLAIAIVTKPFVFEGVQRTQIAQEAIDRLKDRVDTFITIPNDKIFSIINKETSMHKAFLAIDEVLRNAVMGISEIILAPGIINVDFADIKTIVENSGPSIIGVGVATGKERALMAANMAMNSPLLESSLEGARGVLLSISGHRDMKMNEINEIAKLVAENVDPSARIIFGSYYDKKLPKGAIKVTLVATGFGSSFGRNYSLFGDFDIFNKRDTMVDTAVDREQPRLEEGGDVQEEIEEEHAMLVEEKEDESAWDIPAFLRKKKKR